jgi:hypothetical protein
MKTPFVTNCNLIKRKENDILFHAEDKTIHPYLDRYTILPTEQYEKLVNQSPVGTKKT